MSYYNTTNEKGETLKKSRKKAESQDAVILKTFKKFTELGLTPERCLRHLRIMEDLNDNRWAKTPIVSVRRSFSNLKNKGLIYKTEIMANGDYGKKVHTWKLKK